MSQYSRLYSGLPGLIAQRVAAAAASRPENVLSPAGTGTHVFGQRPASTSGARPGPPGALDLRRQDQRRVRAGSSGGYSRNVVAPQAPSARAKAAERRPPGSRQASPSFHRRTGQLGVPSPTPGPRRSSSARARRCRTAAAEPQGQVAVAAPQRRRLVVEHAAGDLADGRPISVIVPSTDPIPIVMRHGAHGCLEQHTRARPAAIDGRRDAAHSAPPPANIQGSARQVGRAEPASSAPWAARI